MDFMDSKSRRACLVCQKYNRGTLQTKGLNHKLARVVVQEAKVYRLLQKMLRTSVLFQDALYLFIVEWYHEKASSPRHQHRAGHVRRGWKNYYHLLLFLMKCTTSGELPLRSPRGLRDVPCDRGRGLTCQTSRSGKE